MHERYGIEAATRCPECQARVRPDVRFCAACGQTLRSSAIPPARVKSIETRMRFATHWGELKRVGWLFGLLLLSSLVMGLMARVQSSPWLGGAISLVDATLVVYFAVSSRRQLRPLLGRPLLNRRRLFELLAASAALVACLSAYFWLLARAGVPLLHLSESYEQAGWPVGAMFLLTALMPAAFEELAFRGVIQSALGRVFTRREALVIQAALFSVLHLMPIAFPSHFVMGLCFGWMRLRSRSLYPSFLLHLAWNALVLGQELWF
jgi:uncharacterized protein